MKILIASTPKPWEGLINTIQRNAVRNWLRQIVPEGCGREIILYGDDKGTAEACEEFDITHVPDVWKTSYGTPNIGWIFRDLASRPADIYVYINADILISNDNLIKTVAAQSVTTQSGYTGTAPRMGLIVTEEITNWEYLYAATEKIEEPPRCGVDIFIFTKLPPMPDFALGRGFWDKWFVVACTRGVLPFLNFQNSFWTIHQSHDYSHLPIKKKDAWDTRGFIWEQGEGKGPETKINLDLFRRSFPSSNIKQPFVKNCSLAPPIASPTVVKPKPIPAYPKSYHLLKRRRAGTGHHRFGWPLICSHLQRGAEGKILLDDFVSQSFEWGEAVNHTKPWVGIFHHPVTINGPPDNPLNKRTILNFPRDWKPSKKHLIGAITFCSESAEYLKSHLNIPVANLLYPTVDAPKWSIGQLHNRRPFVMLQVGEAHRNIRFIHTIKRPTGWCKKRLVRNSSVMRKIDDSLKPLYPEGDVIDLPRLSNREYDSMLSSCVVVQQVYGAAANNVVVECLARGTPIITNRLPALEEYLGVEYPLFYEDGQEVPKIPESFWYASVLQKASEYLRERSKILPSIEEFVANVDEFIKSL